ncbi:MAG: amidase family protein [Gammaproteobacteria bacterium]
MWRTALVCAWSFAMLPVQAAAPSDAEIVGWDALTLRAELAEGRVSAEHVTQVFLRRIAALNEAGPTLRAVIEINPDALAIARRLDRQRSRGGLGPLHGVPVLLKANIDTADRMATSAGSLALAAHSAREDAVVAARLRAAGAVLLGKTNLSEWANFRSTASTSGWSSLGGQTRNPYVLDRNPCGSSSGSAVAVAARLAPLAVGTETDGSIVCPAGANGVVGVKPTLGAISQRGIVPVARSQDTAGPLARSVADAALLFGVLAGATGGVSQQRVSLAGLKVGVVRNYLGAGRNAAVEAGFDAALAVLRQLQAELIDPVIADGPPDGAEHTVLVAEFHDGVAAYLSNVRKGPRTLNRLIEFNADHATEVMPLFGQELFLEAQASNGTADPRYQLATAAIATARSALAAEFERHNLAALVAPVNAPAWRNDLSPGDRIPVSSSSIAAVSGYPSVVLPFTMAGELPLGIAIIGRPGTEALLLEIAALAERVRGPFPEPRFLPTVPE